MKRFLSINFLIVSGFLSFNTVTAQEVEGGIGFGASNYLGEIGGDPLPRRPFILDLQYPQTKPAIGTP
jgi:hypothetical protein